MVHQIIIVICMILACQDLAAESKRTNFAAEAFVPIPRFSGITSATVQPPVIRSNTAFQVLAHADGPALQCQVFFSRMSNIQDLSNQGGTWSTPPLSLFRNQAVYTAGFIVSYTNYTVTNWNSVFLIVDNTCPVFVSSTPSNNSFIESSTWDFFLRLLDLGGAGLDDERTRMNSFLFYAGEDDIWGTPDDRTNAGIWTNTSADEIKFIPVPKPTVPGKYKVLSFPVDKAGNTNFLMQDPSQAIYFMQTDRILLTRVEHKFQPDTQLTPGVPLEVILRGTSKRTAFFELIGSTNIRNIPMTEISNGIYRGVYVMTSRDTVRDGIVRATLLATNVMKSCDADIRLDAGEKVLASRGKDIYIVSRDDVLTRIKVPDCSLNDDVRIDIRRNNLFGDKIAFDFNMTSFDTGRPVIYFEKPLRIFIHYTVNEDKVEQLNIPEKDLDDSASLLFFDRVQWLKVGGTVDTENDEIAGDVRHFSIFALGVWGNNKDLTVAPNPFTPNRDNDFDRLHFVCDIGPEESHQVRISIFSLDGFLRKVLELKDGTLNGHTADILWDGKDDKQQDCVQGLYVYQARIGNRRFQGTFVLAR
ncbi:MAG: hypothetical protein PHF84_06070 [bacterium]|nr:hypothetical protein [bacterium]